MSLKNTKFSVGAIVAKKRKDEKTVANPINLEALVNSGRVRVEGTELKKVSDKSVSRKSK